MQTTGKNVSLQKQSSSSAFLFFTGGFLLFAALMLFLYFAPRYYPEVKDHTPAEYFFAYAVGAGQFRYPPEVYITPRCDMGEKLVQRNFPGNFTVDAGLFSKKQIFRNIPEKFLYGAENKEKGKADIVFAVPCTVSFPSDAFLTAQHLFPLKEKLVPGGVFILLLPGMEADLYQQITDHTAPLLCLIYKNVLPVAFPKMLLASDRPLITDTEKLEKNLLSFTDEEKVPFPEGFLNIFVTHLPQSRIISDSSLSGISVVHNSVFPWKLREKRYGGVMGDVWYFFRLWTEFFHQFFYYCWTGVLLIYFCVRYFCSPGEKRKRLFHFFEEMFFLAGLPVCVFLTSPGKWEKNTIVLFLFLPVLLSFFFTLVLFLTDKAREKYNREVLSSKGLFYGSLPSVFAPLLIFAVCHQTGEKFLSSLFSPQGIQGIILCLMLAASMANSCILYRILKGMCLKQIPLLVTVFLSACAAVIMFIAAAGYGGIYPVLIPLLLMWAGQFALSYRT